jgi:choline dehydrogenase-like flavoprotein
MAGFDYDVVVIGSGFGGSVAAFRAVEKGYRGGVMESGKRWTDEDIPKVNWNLAHFLWRPEAAGSPVRPCRSASSVACLLRSAARAAGR